MEVEYLIIESEHIKLVPLEKRFAEEIFTEFNEDVCKYMYPAPALTIDETYEFINSTLPKIKEGKDYTFVILKKDTDEFIGCGGVHHLQEDIPEFGIWTKVSSHGNHYGYEAIKAAYDYFKPYYKAFLYPVDMDNTPSKKIPLKLDGKLNKRIDQLNQQGRLLKIEEYLVPGNLQ